MNGPPSSGALRADGGSTAARAPRLFLAITALLARSARGVLPLLAILATFLACAAFAPPQTARRESSRAVASLERDVPEPGSQWRDGTDQVPDDLQAVESVDDDDDDDDDKDPLSDVAGDPAMAFSDAPAPPRPARALRRETATDPSRFAAASGLPRGPPV